MAMSSFPRVVGHVVTDEERFERFARQVARLPKGLRDRIIEVDMARSREPSASRSGFTGLFGKIDDEPVNGLRLPITVIERAKQRAVEAGLPFHEYLREIVTLGVMGRDEVERRFRARLDAIERKVHE